MSIVKRRNKNYSWWSESNCLETIDMRIVLLFPQYFTHLPNKIVFFNDRFFIQTPPNWSIQGSVLAYERINSVGTWSQLCDIWSIIDNSNGSTGKKRKMNEYVNNTLFAAGWEIWMEFQKNNFKAGFSDRFLKHLLWNCRQLNVSEPYWQQPTLLQLMAWYRQATSHYLNQYWYKTNTDTVLCRHMAELGHNEINLSPSSAAYMRQWIGSALVQIMACRLFGAKPLSKPMLGCCQLDS